MKIGILTFHAAHNYGSMLLAYALQEALKEEGHEVKIINHRIYAQNMMYANPLKFTHKTFIKELFTNPLLYFRNAKKWKKFESFSHNYHNLTSLCPTLVEVESVIKHEKFDAVVTGGDQIWNMQCADFSLAYYLPFDLPGVRKISYSPSFGGGGVFKPENYSCSIQALLECYDNISVREISASHLVSDLLKRPIPIVCDPTLLLKTSNYSKLAGSESLVKGKYIFYYSPFSTPETEKVALEYGKRANLPVYTSNGSAMQCKGMKRMPDVGPIEFLNLIKYSEIVCGNSFHMAVFSVILQKNFFIISKKDARMETLLQNLGISNRSCTEVGNVNFENQRIDWKNVEQKLSCFRQNSIEYLRNALNVI